MLFPHLQAAADSKIDSALKTEVHLSFEQDLVYADTPVMFVLNLSSTFLSISVPCVMGATTRGVLRVMQHTD